jgi:MFS family permease
MNLFNFALLIVVFSVANSSAAVSGVVIAFTLPSLLFGILAGVLVDRWDKKRVLFLTNIIRALLVLPLVFFHGNLAVIYAITFLVSLATQFFIPAETPIIPLLVKREQLLSANALFGMGIYASIFLAYALSGPFLFIFGKQNIFTFLASLFLIAGFFSSLIMFKKTSIKKEKKVIILGIKEEISMVLGLIARKKSLYHALFSLTLTQILILVLAVIGPGYAEQILKIKVESFPILFVTPAIFGLALGAIVIGSYLNKHLKSSMTRFGLFLMAFSILLLPYGSKVESREFIRFLNTNLPFLLQINVVHIMVILAFILGFATSFVFVPANTVLQEETSDQSRGKIYGVLNTLIGVTSIIPVLVVGWLADIIGIKSVITGIGISVLLIAMYRTFADRK